MVSGPDVVSATIDRARLSHGTLRVRPTAAGYGFAGLLFCCLLLAINFSNNLIFAMTFLLLGIVIIAWWQTRQNVSVLLAGKWCSEPVFAGQELVYRLGINNPGRWPGMAVSLSIDDAIEVDEGCIAGQSSLELSLLRCGHNRGWQVSQPVWLNSTFPVGLFRARLRVVDLPEQLVYPALAGRQVLPESGQNRDAHQQRAADDFTDLRRYVAGDPPARIAWQALARTDQLFCKQFDGGDGLPALWLTWDSVFEAGVEAKLSQLCRWVVDAQAQGGEYGLILPGLEISPDSSRAHYLNCLRELALFSEQKTVDDCD